MSIEVNNLTHIYHRGTPLETVALRDISMEVPDGGWVSIVGHTGSGKSTLAQHLDALLLPDEGSVLVDGLSTDVKKDLRKIRRKVGLVFQYPEQQLFAETVREELSFGPKNWGEIDDIDRTLAEVMEQVGLDESYLERSPFKLSGGEKRRVAIASVLAVRPSYLVLDEPTAGLDASGRHRLVELLSRIHSDGTAVIMVTHDLEIALDLSDRIIALEKGTIACQGSPEEIVLSLESRPVSGLVLPDICKIWLGVKNRGMEIPFSCDPIYLADFIADRS
ncbi:ABC transporter related protein [Dethiosulfovibrio peptidovorans DSM 11002]|uniref:ABC transporter related protein n=1 Tax=Dethiosulfovibrio peptidovorans DSM 11002 TaxID=469381 RepID=D2Z943_9BACT|nr:ATP-binding cassette domain-containing protein [Dethiosulfovibrio peptidovorans]EFC91990.1 ABC transporter related protein [Dethiosulfovibrio peptidovorans DSM 11002]